MSDKKSTSTNPNLTDFFKSQGKKKSNPAKTASAQQAPNDEESKHTTTEQKAELAEQIKKQNANYESSDEEKTDITLAGDTATVIKDRKDVEAQKRKQLEEEQSRATGWKALESKSSNNEASFLGSGTQKSQQSGPSVGQPKGASTATGAEIKFTGKPQ